MAIRKNASLLSNDEIATFVNALKELKRSGRYDLYVLQHARATMSNIHRCPGFLSWHRHYLLDLEKELQDISGDPNLGIPYWHWGENGELDNPEDHAIWQENFLGPGGKSWEGHVLTAGPFRGEEWTTVDMQGNPAGPLTRELGESPLARRLPNREEIEALLRVTPFDIPPYNRDPTTGFRNLLEGWYGGPTPTFHNLGHLWVGGSMLPMTSPNDPIFFLHHCFVDKLWWDWQQRHNPMGMDAYLPIDDGNPGQNLNDDMEPGISGQMKAADLLDIIALGYNYDTPEAKIETSISFSPEGSEDGTNHDHNNDNEENPSDDETNNGNQTNDEQEPEPTSGTGSDNTPTSSNNTPTSPGRKSGRGCMVLFLALFVSIFLIHCTTNKNNTFTSFELYNNKEISTSIYWYFDILPGDKDVYKIKTGKEDIYFEVPHGQKSFNIENAGIGSAKVRVITKDNHCFLGNKGTIKGSLNDNSLALEMDFSSLSAISNVQGENILMDRKEKKDYQIKISGTVKTAKKSLE